MKYPSNFRKQIVLMSECARFLSSKERIAPANVLHDNTLWIAWRKQERKKLERFAKYFDPGYFANSVSIWSRLQLKRRRQIDYCRADAVMIMWSFFFAMTNIKQIALDNYLGSLKHKTYYDKELDFIANESGNLLIDIAEKAYQLEVKRFAMNLIDDREILHDFSLRRDRVLAKMAKERIAYLDKILNDSLVT